MTAEDIAN